MAANFINRRITGCNIQAHFCRLENFDIQFYRQFHIIVCGLDSIQARRWINAMLMANLTYNDDGTVNHQSIIPIVDGGTEGFKVFQLVFTSFFFWSLHSDILTFFFRVT